MDVIMPTTDRRRKTDPEISALSQIVHELVREMRGHNGTPGFLTKLATMQLDIAHVKDAIEKMAVTETIMDERLVTKSSVAKILWEVAKPVLTGAIIWLLFQFFPDLFGHLAGGS